MERDVAVVLSGGAVNGVLMELGFLKRLRDVAAQAGLTMPQLALAWVLRTQNVASAIVGASRPEQVRDNAAASGIELDAETLAEVDGILGG